MSHAYDFDLAYALKHIFGHTQLQHWLVLKTKQIVENNNNCHDRVISVSTNKNSRLRYTSGQRQHYDRPT